MSTVSPVQSSITLQPSITSQQHVAYGYTCLYDYINLWLRRTLQAVDMCILIVYPIYIMALTLGNTTNSPLYDNTNTTPQCRTYAILMIVMYAIELIIIYIAYVQYKLITQSVVSSICTLISVALITLFFTSTTCQATSANGFEVYAFIVVTARIFVHTLMCIYIGLFQPVIVNEHTIRNNNTSIANNIADTEPYNESEGQLLLLSQLQYAKLKVLNPTDCNEAKDIIINIDNTTIVESLTDALNHSNAVVQNKAQQIAQSDALIDALQYMNSMRSNSSPTSDTEYHYILALNPNGSYRMTRSTSSSDADTNVSSTVQHTNTTDNSEANDTDTHDPTEATTVDTTTLTQSPDWIVRQYPQLMVHQSGNALIVDHTITVAEQRITNNLQQRRNPYLSALIRAPVMYLNNHTAQNINLPMESGLSEISVTAPLSLQQAQIDQLQIHTVVMRNKSKRIRKTGNLALPPLHTTPHTVDLHYNSPVVRDNEVKHNTRQVSYSTQRNELMSPLPVYSIDECKHDGIDDNVTHHIQHSNGSCVIDINSNDLPMPWSRTANIMHNRDINIQTNNSPVTTQNNLQAVQRSSSNMSNGSVQLYLPRASSHTSADTQNPHDIQNIIQRATSSPNHHTNTLLTVPSSPVRTQSVSQADSIRSQLQHDDENFYGCNICLTEYCETDQCIYLPCIHQYHAHCIRPWLQHKNSCPQCRLPVFISIPTVYIH